MHITRRAFLGTAPAAALAGCGVITTTSAGSGTTVTVNTARADAWGQAFINAASMLAPFAGAAAPAILAIGAVAKADLAAFDTASGGSLVLTFPSGSVPAKLAAVLADGQKLLAAAQADMPAKIGTEAQTALNALATIVSTAEAVVGVSPTLAAARLSATAPMSESAALKVLKVQ